MTNPGQDPESLAEQAIVNGQKGDKDEKTEAASPKGMATVGEVFSFGAGLETKLLMLAGFFFAIVAGAVGPFMIFYFAKSFEDLSGDPTTEEYMDTVKELAFTFLVLGVVALASLSAYSTFLCTAAGQMTIDLKTKWYQALLRQDLAFYDIQDVSGTATLISSNAAKYERGIGNKLGLAIQFTCSFIGGIIYAFTASWKVSLITLTTVPFMAASGLFIVKMSTSQTARANSAYAEAGSIVYTTVTNIRTVLALNAVETMIEKFKAGTEKGYKEAVSQVHLLGLANGCMMSSMLLSAVAVPLYGGYVLYDQVREIGCDPSGAMPGNDSCDPSGTDVFGSMFGIFFAASMLPQITTTSEAFIGARAACYMAIEVMKRQVDPDAKGTDAKDTSTAPIRRKAGASSAAGQFGDLSALPEYTIDSSSPDGVKLGDVAGKIEFKNVTFAYPTRLETKVFDNFSLQIEAGKTIALVGSSGSGKSTIAQLVERFYDPSSGSVYLDGTDLRDINVQSLRQTIGLVSQEPSLFACSIGENIAYGLPGATISQIEEAAKLANCYDFITEFPDGFETQVGDHGTQLSGGQKQRIAIARMLIKNPQILVLDEATSALDSESERVVQSAIDKLLESGNRTTIVIAHRLSTIRNADVIAVLDHGKLVETGSHDELIEKEGDYFKLYEAQKAPAHDDSPASSNPASGFSSKSSSFVETDSNPDDSPLLKFHHVAFHYPSRPDAKILKHFDLTVRQGETLALVGPSGHGKSTVIQLIERFYDPTEGSIELEGVDLKSRTPQWLRAQIGLVSQEPKLFDTTIAENIRFGMEGVTQEEIEKAAVAANAGFIWEFPDGFDTQVGEGGTQVSGGQKQRICIARVLLRRPKLLLLDEATSALDTKSERLVQEALDKITASDQQTTLVIAHRLSTIRNADRIAVIVDGTVKEIGTYNELMNKDGGAFRRLQAFQSADDALAVLEREPETKKSSTAAKFAEANDLRRKAKEKKEREAAELEAIDKEREKRNANRARELSKGDEIYFLIGGIGAIFAGVMFPAWGFIYAYMVELLYQPVEPCEGEGCEEYLDGIAEEMRDLSHKIAIGSSATIVASLVGYVMLFYGFGTATERMNKRVRDAAYEALIRQEVAYFDVRAVGTLTSQLQDDAALIHSFSGEPIRTLVINVSSVVVGLVIGFIYMWPFALIFCGILPFMGFGAEMEMRMYYNAEDEGDDTVEDEHSPGGIVIESLLNIRTVASLTLEEKKLKEYNDALWAEIPNPMITNFLKGSGFGLGQFFQFWGMALMFWFGAWILHTQNDTYEYKDFTIALFGLFFSLYGLTVALEGATDRKRAKLAADRIFDLIDRASAIDPLQKEEAEETESTENGVAKTDTVELEC